MSDLDAVERASNPALTLVWAETPSNPRMKIHDIRALARIAHAHQAQLVCDNTFATPVLQQPLALGADVVMHSTTKYFGGHSDVLGGGLVFARRDDLYTAGRAPPAPGRRNDGAVQCLADIAWLPLAAGAHGDALRQRAQGRRLPGHARRKSKGSIIPACRRIPVTPSRQARCTISAACCRSNSRVAAMQRWRWRDD